ncbi:hypothetical protein [Grimontia hollisae]|uniref:hypothetical protein n=1 Tax=Grimontia hollisae TaxID=673 RepID=UPI0012ACB4E6|nr:hypothetical protein [Grimontia hollisae]
MPHNISLNHTAPISAPDSRQELSGISVATAASALSRVDSQRSTGELELPQGVSASDSCLESEDTSRAEQSEVKSDQAEKKKKVNKKSNKYSNNTKAKGHLAAIAGATTLGAVLAPFTGGLSLLPTAFVVLFGNATALAMYGGSEFVVGQQGPKDQIEDKKEPEEDKQPQDLVPVEDPRPNRNLFGLDEVDAPHRRPEDNGPGENEPGARGNYSYTYAPVFNINVGDLNFSQFNTQNNTHNNTQNNNDVPPQGENNEQPPTLIERTIERFGEIPVNNVVEIDRSTLIREIREQAPIIGPEPQVDEMVDALVAFHEQVGEAKLIKVDFEGGHKAYIGGIPESGDAETVEPVKAEVVVEKTKKQWPEVKPAQRLITTNGNATVGMYSGYHSAKIEHQGQTVGYANVEDIAKQPQFAEIIPPSQSGKKDIASQTDVEHSSVATQTTVEQGTQTEATFVDTQTGSEATGHAVKAELVTDHVNVEHAKSGAVKKWPEVAAPQRVITTSGNAKVDGNPGYVNVRVEKNGQTVGYARSERVGSQSQLAETVNMAQGSDGKVQQGQSTQASQGVETVGTQTGAAQTSVSTQTTVEQGTQTEATFVDAQTGSEATGHAVKAELVTDHVNVEQAKSGAVKKWPEVAAPQRVITTSGNAKVDGNPGYVNVRVEKNGQTTGYARSERVGSQSQQAETVNMAQGSDGKVQQGQATQANQGGKSVAAQTGEAQQSVSTQTGVEQGTQTDVAFVDAQVTTENVGRAAKMQQGSETGGVEQGSQTSSDVEANGSVTADKYAVKAELVTDHVNVEQAKSGAVKKWPEVAAPQRVITTSGNAKVDGNPGYVNVRVEKNGQTTGYARSERVGSQSQQAETVNVAQGNDGKVQQGQATQANQGGKSIATQTGEAKQAVSTQTGVEQGTQTDAAFVDAQVTTENVGHAAKMQQGSETGGVEQGSQTSSDVEANGSATADKYAVKAELVTDHVNVEQVQSRDGKKWPEVAAPQRVITTAGNAKVDSNPGYVNVRVEKNGQTVGYARSERVGSQSQQAETVNVAQGNDGKVQQGQATQANQGGKSIATQTGEAKQAVSTQTGVEQGTQTDAAFVDAQVTTENVGRAAKMQQGSETGGVEQGSQTSSDVEANGSVTADKYAVKAELVTDHVNVEQVQSRDGKKWPEVAAPQRVITTAGNAKVDSNPGYVNVRVEKNGQTVGYARSERVGSQSQQAETVNVAQGNDGKVQQGQATQANQGGKSIATQTGEAQQSVSTQTGVEQGTQTDVAFVDAQVTTEKVGHAVKMQQGSATQDVAKGTESESGFVDAQVTTEKVGHAVKMQQGSATQDVAKGTEPESGFVDAQVTTEKVGHAVKMQQGSATQDVAKGTEPESGFVDAQVTTENVGHAEKAQQATKTADVEREQNNGGRKWPDVIMPQRVITTGGNAKVDGNPGYTNAKVEISGATYGYQRAQRSSSQSSLFAGINPLTSKSEAATERKKVVSDITKLVDIESLKTTTVSQQDAPPRYVSKLHITLKGNQGHEASTANGTHDEWQVPTLIKDGVGVNRADKVTVSNGAEGLNMAVASENTEAANSAIVQSNITGKKWTVKLPQPVLTTQGTVSARGKNFTQGLFNNMRDLNTTKTQIEMTLPSGDITEKKPVSVVVVGERALPVKPLQLSNLKVAS